MSEFIQGLFDLLSQLIDIGSEHPQVLIATMVLIAGGALTCILFCITVVLSIPFVIVRGIFGLIKWIYEIHHPQLYYQEYYEEEDEEPPKVNHRRRKGKEAEEPPELDPVLPHWLNQKGGRLL